MKIALDKDLGLPEIHVQTSTYLMINGQEVQVREAIWCWEIKLEVVSALQHIVTLLKLKQWHS